MSSESPIDLEYLNQISEGDTDFELELLQVFVEDTLEHLEASRQAIATGDYNQLAREAHHMKGASGNVGSQAMQLLATELEHQAKQSSGDKASETLVQLEVHLAQVQTFMASYA